MTRYKGFGSFHSANVQELVTQDEASYAPPRWPVPDPLEGSEQELAQAPLGLAARAQFLVDFGNW